jgi:Ni/Co efflux regulator RcnB
MKRLILSAAAALLLTAAPALAAPNHNNNHGSSHGSSHSTAHLNRTAHVKKNVHVNRTVNVHRNVHVNRTVHNTRSRSTRGTTWHRGAAGRSGVHVRVNIGGLRANINSPRRYHYGTYSRPSGWYAHRWTYGERLPRGWYGSNYRIGNYVSFGLVAPPDGYEWVRVGDDALLIDVNTGEVVRSEYSVFD